MVASTAELGFANGATYADVCAKAQELGLQLCPAEVGPQLRIQYTDQPKDEWLRIAMDPLADRNGVRYIFHVGHSNDGLWLDSGAGRSVSRWDALERGVFLLPRK